MKKILKKVLALSLCACMVVGMSTGASAAELGRSIILQGEKEISLTELYSNPENYPDITLIIYDNIYEYIDVIENDENLSEIDKNRIINKAKIAGRSSVNSYKYGTIRQTVRVDSAYSVYPYFILNLNIHRAHQHQSVWFQ